MSTGNDETGRRHDKSRDSGTAQWLAERLMEAVAGIGYNAPWYDEQARRALEMGREFTQRMLLETREWTMKMGTNTAIARVERAERLLVGFVARRGAIPPPGEAMREIVLEMFETAVRVERSLARARARDARGRADRRRRGERRRQARSWVDSAEPKEIGERRAEVESVQSGTTTRSAPGRRR